MQILCFSVGELQAMQLGGVLLYLLRYSCGASWNKVAILSPANDQARRDKHQNVYMYCLPARGWELGMFLF